MGSPVVHFEIMGGDGPALQKFYSETFGWKINAENPMDYGMADTDSGGNGIGGGVGASEDGKPFTTVYIEVGNVSEKLSEVEAAGGTVVMPETVVPGMVTFGLFSDPQGNVVGVVASESPE